MNKSMAIGLMYANGMTAQQVGDLFGVTLSTARFHIKRCRAALGLLQRDRWGIYTSVPGQQLNDKINLELALRQEFARMRAERAERP